MLFFTYAGILLLWFLLCVILIFLFTTTLKMTSEKVGTFLIEFYLQRKKETVMEMEKELGISGSGIGHGPGN